jgi:hypothetical protein
MTLVLAIVGTAIMFALMSIADALRRIASAIEARRAETAQTGSVHESAVPNGETPNA